MKKTIPLFLLSALSLFASSTLNIYHDKAQIIQTNEINSNTITKLPQEMIDDSFTLYNPTPAHFTITTKNKTSLQSFWQTHVGKNVIYDSKTYVLQLVAPPYALIEKNGKLQTVKLEKLTFSKTKLLPTTTKEVVLPKSYTTKALYSYLFHGLRWKADYVLTFSKTKKRSNLKGVISVKNGTNTTFTPEKLQFIAGEPNGKRYGNTPYPVPVKMAYEAKSVSKKEIAQEQKGNYFIYSIDKKTLVPAKRTLKIAFIDTTLHIQSKYKIHTNNPRYLYNKQKHTPSLHISFTTPVELPRGDVAFYDNEKLFLGSSTIDSAAKGQKKELVVGKDFFSQLTEIPLNVHRFKNGFDATVKYKIINGSDTIRNYDIVVPLENSYETQIVTSIKYKKPQTNQAVFQVRTPPHTTKTFQVIYKYERKRQ